MYCIETTHNEIHVWEFGAEEFDFESNKSDKTGYDNLRMFEFQDGQSSVTSENKKVVFLVVIIQCAIFLFCRPLKTQNPRKEQ